MRKTSPEKIQSSSSASLEVAAPQKVQQSSSSPGITYTPVYHHSCSPPRAHDTNQVQNQINSNNSNNFSNSRSDSPAALPPVISGPKVQINPLANMDSEDSNSNLHIVFEKLIRSGGMSDQTSNLNVRLKWQIFNFNF